MPARGPLRKEPTWKKGKEILRNSGLAITPADNLRQAAEGRGRREGEI